ncbi:DoxX family protein [Propionibacterium sp.]|uniref:DoxX family protein n=1 Tax=Propionibacterium sp. TaxID=1977903 RepID=UPI0039EBD105
MSFPKFVARSMLASMFVISGVNAVKHSEALAPATDALLANLPRQITDSLPDIPSEQLVKINGATMTVAGSALALGILPRFASLVLAAQLVPVTVAGHRYWEKEGGERRGQLIHFQKNVALVGGLLLGALGGAKKVKKFKK